MKHFSFQVPGWTNTQVVRAANIHEAEGFASLIAGDFYGLTEVPEDEYNAIIESWY